MNYSLKNPAQQFPPNGFPFTDPRTGMRFGGMEGTPQFQATRIIAHRQANPKLYPATEAHWFDQRSVENEVLAEKFKAMPWLFKGQPDQQPLLPGQQSKVEQVIVGDKCSCGSTQYTARFCSTCSGRKVIGKKCLSCGKET